MKQAYSIGETLEYWTYDEIKQLSEKEADMLSIEKLDIKGFSVYLVDFGGYYGYSALVYGNGRHIYHVDDFELHHKGKTRSELRALFIEKLSGKLFTEEEIAAPLKDYNEYTAKDYFIRNYWPMQFESISIFHCCKNDEERKAILDKVKDWHKSRLCMCWFKDLCNSNKAFELWLMLERAQVALKDNLEYWKNAFMYEMNNHEYGINWQADYDTLSAFGRIDYTEADNEIEDYFNQLDFNETQRRAYIAALREYRMNE